MILGMSKLRGGRKHSNDVLILGAEGSGSLLREAQQIKEGDGEGGQRGGREFLG